MRGPAWSLQRRVRELALLTAWRVRGDMSPEAPTVVGGPVSRLGIPRQVRSCNREAMFELEDWRSQALYTPSDVNLFDVPGKPPQKPPKLLGMGGC